MYLRKFSLPIKGLVNTSRTLGKRQIKTQQNFYIQNCEIKVQRKYNVLQYFSGGDCGNGSSSSSIGSGSRAIKQICCCCC